ncbi:agglutinin biogenesis protein MshP [Noviherbaspirillum cavernae]|uniref:agglutinin biogenesis protein MshP n=1 Tax=Noviherbaspirillum cavernae TaxID=2320862 RepID=UPI0018F3FCF0|nr:agglutinin biogenesis protein MshP [Noviherbaspirillum cavernae]
MRLNASLRPRRLLQQGFGMVSAIFLLVVLAGLGAAMLNLSATQHTGVALDVQGARAYQAARAGIEWGLHRWLIDVPAGACPASSASFSPSASTLSSFTVTVVCQDTTYAGADPAIVVRQLTAIACNQPVGGPCVKGQGGGADYVERVVQVSFQR